MMSAATVMLVGGLNRAAPYFANVRGKGLHAYAFDEETGAATLLCEATGIDNPTYLSLSADGRFAYANSEVFGWPEGAVSAYRCDLVARRLRPINMQPSLGSITAHSSFDRSGRFLLVANYGMGPMDEGPNRALAVYPLRQDGGLAPPVASVAHQGKGPNTARQERPHPHCVLAAPDNRFVIVADLGLDALIAYRFGPDGRLDEGSPVRSTLPPGCGPRHFAFRSDGRIAVVICELNSTIAALRYHPDSGRFDLIDIVATVPKGAPDNHCSGIAIHPGGRFVYGANRGHDSIAILGLDGETGRLSLLGHRPSGGATPHDMAFDPSGRFLAVANQDSDCVSVFSVDGETGALSPTSNDIPVGTPMCVKFARLR
jgi:6-phosphogluconolactonase